MTVRATATLVDNPASDEIVIVSVRVPAVRRPVRRRASLGGP